MRAYIGKVAISVAAVLLLGGSTVEGMSNKKWIISRAAFRQGTPSIYPPAARASEEAVRTYVDNLRAMKAVLEARRVEAIPDSSLVKTRDFSFLFRDMPETAYVDSVHYYVPASYKLIGEALAKEIESAFFP